MNILFNILQMTRHFTPHFINEENKAQKHVLIGQYHTTGEH